MNEIQYDCGSENSYINVIIVVVVIVALVANENECLLNRFNLDAQSP